MISYSFKIDKIDIGHCLKPAVTLDPKKQKNKIRAIIYDAKAAHWSRSDHLFQETDWFPPAMTAVRPSHGPLCRTGVRQWPNTQSFDQDCLIVWLSCSLLPYFLYWNLKLISVSQKTVLGVTRTLYLFLFPMWPHEWMSCLYFCTIGYLLKEWIGGQWPNIVYWGCL